MRRTFTTIGKVLLPVGLLCLFALGAGGCGGCGSCEDTFWGNVFVDNLTDSSTVEDVDGFFLAPVGGTWTGNLLAGPLPPGFTEFVGTFSENNYDAEADLELGDLVQWFDIFVGYADDVYFEVF